jgi:hypothetical protein
MCCSDHNLAHGCEMYDIQVAVDWVILRLVDLEGKVLMVVLRDVSNDLDNV